MILKLSIILIIFHQTRLTAETCKTWKNETGSCVLIEECPVLDEFFKKHSVTNENRKMIASCGFDLDDTLPKPLICCPPTTPSTPFLDDPINEFCVDPFLLNGTCVPFKTCTKLYELFKALPLSPRNRHILRTSQCGYHKNVPYVCCSSAIDVPQTTHSNFHNEADHVAGWIGVLRKKLPRPPHCGRDSKMDRIFGGIETAIDEFPWMVLLEFEKYTGRRSFHCGGSIINERHVLTAAHCVKKIPQSWNLTSVVIGEWNTETDEDCSPEDANFCAPPIVRNRIIEAKVHKDYEVKSNNQYYDIALLRLEDIIVFNDFVEPICLPLDDVQWTQMIAGQSLAVAGWGKTERVAQSLIKLRVILPYVSYEACNKAYRMQSKNVIDSQLCAGGNLGQDSCSGDSGGPLMNFASESQIPHWFLAGIVSFGPLGCGTKDLPGVYTKVSSFLQWISSNLND